jgi:uncharacterized phage-associated protein
MPLRFGFNERKAVEALTFIADRWPRVTPFFVSKALFFAEKWHLNQYGRPIIADTFIAMPWGPVPSTVYDFIRGQLQFAGDPDAFQNAVKINTKGEHLELEARRKPNTELLSASDIECIEAAIQFCKLRSVHELSELTHHERAWREAPVNGAMDYEAFIDDKPNRDELIEEAREFAAYGVL